MSLQTLKQAWKSSKTEICWASGGAVLAVVGLAAAAVTLHSTGIWSAAWVFGLVGIAGGVRAANESFKIVDNLARDRLARSSKPLNELNC